MTRAASARRDARWAAIDGVATLILLGLLISKPTGVVVALDVGVGGTDCPSNPARLSQSASRQRGCGTCDVSTRIEDTVRREAEVAAWRTGDLPLWSVAAGYVLASGALLALAGSGSWFGMVGAAVISTAEIGLIIVWAGAPMDTVAADNRTQASEANAS